MDRKFHENAVPFLVVLTPRANSALAAGIRSQWITMSKHVLWSAESLNRFGLRVGPETGFVHGVGQRSQIAKRYDPIVRDVEKQKKTVEAIFGYPKAWSHTN